MFFPFMLAWLMFTSTPGSMMALYNYDWIICRERHYFFSVDFGFAYLILSFIMYIGLLILVLSLLAVKVRIKELEK